MDVAWFRQNKIVCLSAPLALLLKSDSTLYTFAMFSSFFSFFFSLPLSFLRKFVWSRYSALSFQREFHTEKDLNKISHRALAHFCKKNPKKTAHAEVLRQTINFVLLYFHFYYFGMHWGWRRHHFHSDRVWMKFMILIGRWRMIRKLSVTGYCLFGCKPVGRASLFSFLFFWLCLGWVRGGEGKEPGVTSGWVIMWHYACLIWVLFSNCDGPP